MTSEQASFEMTLEQACQFADWFNQDAWGLGTQLYFATVDECQEWIKLSKAQDLWQLFCREKNITVMSVSLSKVA